MTVLALGLILACIARNGVAQMDNPLIIFNNHQIARVYHQPEDERGMTMPAFRAWVYKYCEKNRLHPKRLRFIKCITCLQREAYEMAVLYFE